MLGCEAVARHSGGHAPVFFPLMKKPALLLLMMLVVVPTAYPCSMAFPAYGVYSGGTVLLRTYLEWNFALLMAGAIFLKAVSYMFMGNGSKPRLFGAMVAGNLVTTVIGLLMEFFHAALFNLLLLPACGAMALFYHAGKILRPLDYRAFRPKLTLMGVAGIFTLLYVALSVLGWVLTGTQHLGFWHWGLKWIFGCGSLIVALFVTTSYEYGVVTWVTKQSGRDVFLPVLKANLIVFFVLFASVAGVLWSQHKLPNP
jgi:hypothetical protein